MAGRSCHIAAPHVSVAEQDFESILGCVLLDLDMLGSILFVVGFVLGSRLFSGVRLSASEIGVHVIREKTVEQFATSL